MSSHASEKKGEEGEQQDNDNRGEQSQNQPNDTTKQEDLPLGQRVQQQISSQFEKLPSLPDLSGIRDRLPDGPDFSNTVANKILTIRKHLSDEPDSLASEIWQDAQDPKKNPDVAKRAELRISPDLPAEEKEFVKKRKEYARKAFANYIGVPVEEVHPEDVPSIAIASSGGSLRALCANSGTLAAAQEDGFWDCVTYTTGLSSGCWLLSLYYSSFIGQDFHKLIQHLRERLPLPTLWPPDGLDAFVDEKTGKYLMAGLVEKMKETPHFDLGVVDLFGMFTGYKLFLPSDSSKLKTEDLKMSSQVKYLSDGQNPLPIYTACRHEKPPERPSPRTSGSDTPDEKIKSMQAKENEATFQLWEFTPFELYSEELGAGVPTWATGRHFKAGKQATPEKEKDENGKIQLKETDIGAPELKTPYLLGLWGSAFCATMARWYSEFRPLLSLPTFKGDLMNRVDKIMEDYSSHLGSTHLVDSAIIPNYFTGLTRKDLAQTTPKSILEPDDDDPGLRFTDSGMSGRMPLYPLLRKGREVDVILALDASADVGGPGWGEGGLVSQVDGFTVQRGIKAEAIKRGWPFKDTPIDEVTDILEKARLRGAQDAGGWLKIEKDKEAKNLKSKDKDQQSQDLEGEQKPEESGHPEGSELDYCNVFVGQALWRETPGDKPPPWKFEFDMPEALENESGENLFKPLAETPAKVVMYMPLLPNKDAPPLQPPPTRKESQTQWSDYPAALFKGSIFDIMKSSSEKNQEEKARPIDPMKEDFMSTWNFEYTPEQVDAVADLARTNYEVSKEKIKRVLKGAWEAKRNDRLAREKEE